MHMMFIVFRPKTNHNPEKGSQKTKQHEIWQVETKKLHLIWNPIGIYS